jgi:hypothetical protein
MLSIISDMMHWMTLDAIQSTTAPYWAKCLKVTSSGVTNSGVTSSTLCQTSHTSYLSHSSEDRCVMNLWHQLAELLSNSFISPSPSSCSQVYQPEKVTSQEHNGRLQRMIWCSLSPGLGADTRIWGNTVGEVWTAWADLWYPDAGIGGQSVARHSAEADTTLCD